jgi:hypothetical protein
MINASTETKRYFGQVFGLSNAQYASALPYFFSSSLTGLLDTARLSKAGAASWKGRNKMKNIQESRRAEPVANRFADRKALILNIFRVLCASRANHLHTGRDQTKSARRK